MTFSFPFERDISPCFMRSRAMSSGVSRPFCT
jgi:hypothetical protein